MLQKHEHANIPEQGSMRYVKRRDMLHMCELLV